MINDIIINANGKAEIKPTKNQTEITEFGCIYLMRDPKSDKHHVYKAHLHKAPTEKGKDLFRWTGIWNSVVYTGEPKEKLEDLIADAIKNGCIVKKYNFDDLHISI